MFQISAHGTRDGVIKKIGAAKVEPPVAADAGQVESLKTLLVAEVNALPTEFNGARVTAQCEAHAGGRTLQATIQPLKLEL